MYNYTNSWNFFGGLAFLCKLKDLSKIENDLHEYLLVVGKYV